MDGSVEAMLQRPADAAVRFLLRLPRFTQLARRDAEVRSVRRD
jgi:hypothetical protein